MNQPKDVAPASSEETRPNSSSSSSAVDPVRTRSTAIAQAVFATIILVAAAALVTWVFQPGYMNADTLVQYASTQTGPINDWYAPILQLLWDGALAVGVGRPTYVLFGQVFALLVGCYLLFSRAVRSWVAATLAVILLASPLVLSQVMLLGRDMWFLCFIVLQAALLALAVTRSDGRAWALIAASVACGVLAVAARQNGAAFALPIFFLTVEPSIRRIAPRAKRGAAYVLTALTAIAVTAVAYSGLQVVQRIAGVGNAQPEAVLFAYDLAAMSIRLDDNLFGPAAFPSGDLRLLADRWNPDDAVSLLVPNDDPAVRAFYSPPDVYEELKTSWSGAILDHPTTYLAERASLFSRLIGISSPPLYVMHNGIDGNPFGFALANPDANEAARSYVAWFDTGSDFAEGSYLFRPWPYLAGGAIAAIVLLRRKRPPSGVDRIVAYLVVGALLYELTFFFVAPGHGYRYSYPAMVVSLVAITYLAARIVTDHRRGRQHDASVVDA